MDNPKSKDYNVEKQVLAFIAYVKNQASYFKTNHILITFGMDFHYQASHTWFKNTDKLIRYVNERQANGSDVNLLYSTPSCYLKSLNEAGKTWPTKSDDFFPYASDPHAYWSGYFSSRPTSKRMIHESSNLVQVAKQTSTALYNKDKASSKTLNVLDTTFYLERTVSVTQHHDAITGTERQHVTDDYTESLAAANFAFHNAAFLDTGFESCPFLNISQCAVTETLETFGIRVYNPMGRTQSRYIHVPISFENAVVTKYPGGEVVTCQTIPLADAVKRIPGRESLATHDLIFKASALPALGSLYFEVHKLAGSTAQSIKHNKLEKMTNFQTEFHFDKMGASTIYKKAADGIAGFNVAQEFMYYPAAQGDNYPAEERASGAYIFRPNATMPTSFPAPSSPVVHDGPIVQEVQEEFNSWVTQIKRIYKDETAFDVEIEWLVGPIPVEDGLGKEIISQFQVDEISNGDMYYTDANGRQMMIRKRNYQPTFNIDSTYEPVSQNYYPVNSRISLVDNGGGGRLTILNDRSQAGGSINDGQVELLVHRRLLYDDAFGVGEALNEEQFGVGLVARGKHYLLVDTDEETANARHRLFANELFMSPHVTFYPGELQQSYVNRANELDVQLNTELPSNVNLLTLQPWYTNGEVAGANRFFLIRLEHLFQTVEHSTLGTEVTIDVGGLLTSLGTVVSMRETTLGGNLFLDEKPTEMTWRSNDMSYVDNFLKNIWAISGSFDITTRQGAFDVILRPMEIRTFIVEIE